MTHVKQTQPFSDANYFKSGHPVCISVKCIGPSKNQSRLGPVRRTNAIRQTSCARYRDSFANMCTANHLQNYAPKLLKFRRRFLVQTDRIRSEGSVATPVLRP